jgi:hypothetical protein
MFVSDQRIYCGKTPAVSIIAYTGGQMVVPGWGLVIDLAGIGRATQNNSVRLPRFLTRKSQDFSRVAKRSQNGK